MEEPGLVRPSRTAGRREPPNEEVLFDGPGPLRAGPPEIVIPVVAALARGPAGQAGGDGGPGQLGGV